MKEPGLFVLKRSTNYGLWFIISSISLIILQSSDHRYFGHLCFDVEEANLLMSYRSLILLLPSLVQSLACLQAVFCGTTDST